ncbi:MAG TPA: hypothetical protein VI933_03230 [archaeon]|nr:hypothetical protein [archaeon]
MAAFAFDFSNQQFLITFLFTLAVIFGVLELGGPFKKNRAVNAVIAFAIAVFGASYGPFQTALWGVLPNITWFFIVMFFIAFTLELFGARKAGGGGLEGMITTAGVLIVLMALGWTILRQFPVQLPFIGGGENLLFLIGFLFVISLFWAAMKMGGGKGGE